MSYLRSSSPWIDICHRDVDHGERWIGGLHRRTINLAECICSTIGQRHDILGRGKIEVMTIATVDGQLEPQVILLTRDILNLQVDVGRVTRVAEGHRHISDRSASIDDRNVVDAWAVDHDYITRVGATGTASSGEQGENKSSDDEYGLHAHDSNGLPLLFKDKNRYWKDSRSIQNEHMA